MNRPGSLPSPGLFSRTFLAAGAVLGRRRLGGPVPSPAHRAALLVIDVQRATLPVMHRPGPTVAVIAGLAARARAARVPVVTVRQRGCGEVLAQLAPPDGEPVVKKTSADAFLDTGLDGTPGRLGVTEVMVPGFATENCAETTARRALGLGHDLVLVADGHTTSVRSGPTGFAPPGVALAHHNGIYRHIDSSDGPSGSCPPRRSTSRPRAPADGGSRAPGEPRTPGPVAP
ncbi:isochorismatase family protein [Streptomyces sp. SID8352]|uniref:isochorismatase family protein n=1 Tax=Streptomyces sp. SID8352 TaxID=2690338 RepID=UPI0031F6AB4A